MTLTLYALRYDACLVHELRKFVKARTGRSTRNMRKSQIIDILRSADRTANIRFLQFPGEIRNMIYKLVLDGEQTITVFEETKRGKRARLWTELRPRGINFTAILRTSKQCYRESQALIYDMTSFRLSSLFDKPDVPGGDVPVGHDQTSVAMLRKMLRSSSSSTIRRVGNNSETPSDGTVQSSRTRGPLPASLLWTTRIKKLSIVAPVRADDSTAVRLSFQKWCEALRKVFPQMRAVHYYRGPYWFMAIRREQGGWDSFQRLSGIDNLDSSVA